MYIYNICIYILYIYIYVYTDILYVCRYAHIMVRHGLYLRRSNLSKAAQQHTPDSARPWPTLAASPRSKILALRSV